MTSDISKCKYFSTLDLKSAYHQVPLKQEDRKYTAFKIDGKLYQFKRIPLSVTNGYVPFKS